MSNLSPKLGTERFNYLNGHTAPPPNAVQWDNIAVIDFLKEECIKLGVTHIVDSVVDANLDKEGYAISAGSACASGSIKGSHTLKEIGVSDVDIEKSYRVSFGKFHRKEDVENLFRALVSHMRESA